MDSVDRLHALCQRAARSGPDPYPAVLRVQFDLVADCQALLKRERDALLTSGNVPEVMRGYQERWAHLCGAIDVYEIAARRAQGDWEGDGEFLHKTLMEQARVVRLLHAEWRLSIDTDPAAFGRHALAQKTFLAGVHAAVDLQQAAASRLGLEVIES